MNQDRGNFVMVLNVRHSEAENLRITKMEALEQQKLCLHKIIDDWINQSVERKNIFASSDSFANKIFCAFLNYSFALVMTSSYGMF